MDEIEHKWIRPVFVVTSSEKTVCSKIEKVDTNQHGEIQEIGQNCWIFFRDTIERIKISILLLLNDSSSNKFVTKFVAKNLINKIINSSKFPLIIKQLKEKNLSQEVNTSIDNKVIIVKFLKFY